jgi:tetratricopeptide (TPR) repeat protein
VELDHENADGYALRGAVRLNLGDIDGALADLSEAIARNPKDSCSYSLRGMILDGSGQSDRAPRDFEHAIDLNPRDYLSLLSRALIRAQRAEYGQALRDSARAVLFGDWNCTVLLAGTLAGRPAGIAAMRLFAEPKWRGKGTRGGNCASRGHE